MNRLNKLFLGIITLFLGLEASSCIKSETDAEKRQEEVREIQSYLKSNNLNVQPTASGLYYISEKEGTGDTPGDKDFVIIRYKGWTLDGRMFDSTDSLDVENGNFTPWFKLSGPFKYKMEYNIPGWNEALKMMKVGGKATAIMPSILAYNDYIPRRFEFELLEVIHDINAYEKQQVMDYLSNKGKSIADSTSGGYYYFETLTGSGDLPTNGKTVSIQYTGKLLDGRIIIQTDATSNYTYVIGSSPSTNKFFIEEALLKMRPGGKATLLVPFDRAYGADDKVNNWYQIVIPWYSTLVYDIQLVSVQ